MPKLEPNVFLIGAPKCGTTALASYFQEHPEMVVSQPKEPHYFCTDFPEKRKFTTYDHYLKTFSYTHRKSPKAVVDASVWYLYSSEALSTIFTYKPCAKIIIGVREPIEFMRSLYNQQVFSGSEDQSTFRDAWVLRHRRRKGKEIPRKCGHADLIDYEELARFAKYVQRWLDVFGDENVFIYSLEELKEDPAKIYNKVLKFLSLSQYQPDTFAVVNEAKQHKYEIVKKLLHSQFFRSGWHKPIKQLFGVRSFRVYETLSKFNIEKLTRRNENIDDLEVNFDTENSKLFDVAGRRLWLYRE